MKSMMQYHTCKLKSYVPPNNNRHFYESIYKQNNTYKIFLKSKCWMRVGDNALKRD